MTFLFNDTVSLYIPQGVALSVVLILSEPSNAWHLTLILTVQKTRHNVALSNFSIRQKPR